MNRLDELSKISNAVLTPHLNCDLGLITHNDGEAEYHVVTELKDIDKRRRKRWCEKQLREIGAYGAVLCGK